MKILIAEDTKDLNRAVSVLLTHEGYEVEQAFDGNQALDLILTGGYDAVILDIMMPGMDGISVLMNMRQTYTDTRYASYREGGYRRQGSGT